MVVGKNSTDVSWGKWTCDSL